MKFFNMYKIEQKLFFRSPDVIIFNLAMPSVTFLIISLIAGNKATGNMGLTFLQSSYAALSTVGICCSAFMSIPITIVDYRSQGVLKRMYCSPCSPARLLVCDTIASGIMAIISTLILSLVAVIFFWLQNVRECFHLYRIVVFDYDFHVFYRIDSCKFMPYYKINEHSNKSFVLSNAAFFWCNYSCRNFSKRITIFCRHSAAGSWNQSA